jgi:hypothetical protein
VVLAPASLIAGRVETATGGTLKTRNVEGTLWRGRGVLTAGDKQLPIAWTVDPQSLLQGELHAHIGSFDGIDPLPHADVIAGREHIVLRDVDLTLPLPLLTQTLGGRLAQRLGLIADGEVTVRSTQLDWLPPAINGDVEVVWRMARLMLPTNAPLELGDVTAKLSANGQRLTGPLENQGGAMDVRGDVTVNGDRSAAVSLLLTPRADDEKLTRALSTVGTPEGNGWRVAWQTPPR